MTDDPEKLANASLHQRTALMDEIERLRIELKEVQEAWHGCCVVIDAKYDEIERLRAALQAICDYHIPNQPETYWADKAIKAEHEIERLRATVNRVIEDLEMVVFCPGHTRLQPCEPECHCVQHYDAVRELIR